MQYLELKELNFFAYHGVFPQERQVGNTYTIDLKLFADFSQAMQSDCLEDTINYVSVYELIKEEMAIPSNLIEHVAARIVRRIRHTFTEIEKVEIRLAKKNPPFGGDIREVAVCL